MTLDDGEVDLQTRSVCRWSGASSIDFSRALPVYHRAHITSQSSFRFGRLPCKAQLDLLHTQPGQARRVIPRTRMASSVDGDLGA